MPGYKSKRACVVLGEGAVTVDFILDPLTSNEDSQLVEDSGCYFDNNSIIQMIDFLPVPQLQVSLLLILMLGFLCFLMKRRVRPNHLNQKQTLLPRRAVV